MLGIDAFTVSHKPQRVRKFPQLTETGKGGGVVSSSQIFNVWMHLWEITTIPES